MENIAQKRMQRLRELDRRKIVVCWTFTAAIAAVMLAWGPEALYWKRQADLGSAPVIWPFALVMALTQLLTYRFRDASDYLLYAFLGLSGILGLLAGPLAAAGAVWLYPHQIPPGDEYMRPAFQFAVWMVGMVGIVRWSVFIPGTGLGYWLMLVAVSTIHLPPELVWAILCASTAALLAVWLWSRTRDEAV